MNIFKATVLLSAMAVSLGVSASERLYLQTPVRFAPGTFAPESVRNECELQQHLVDDASTMISKHYRRVEFAAPGDEVGDDQVVKITIINAWGAGGGSWSGPKSLQILAELKQGDTTLSSASFRRSTSVGMFKGTCGMFHKITKELGGDVAGWLKNGAPQQPGATADIEPAQKPAE